MPAPNTRDLFGGETTTDGKPLAPAEMVMKFEQYKDVLNKSLGDPTGPMSPEQRQAHKAFTAVKEKATLNKAFSPEVLESLSQEFGRNSGFLQKDLDLAGPGSTGGLHAYDLEAPAKMLVPRNTPLRNRIARKQGVGTAHELKRITGFTGSQTGNLPLIHPGQAETDTETFGTLQLRRGKKISYAGDHITIPYRQFAISDSVSWAAQFAGQGYQSLQQLSSTSTLYAAMLLEENMLLDGRGTAAGFSGAVATPGTVTVTTPVAGTSPAQTAVTGAGANVYVSITATTVWGETALSAVGNSAFTTGDVIVASWAQVPGASGYNIFVGTGSSAPATSATWYATTTAGNSVTIQGALPTSGRAASTVNASATPTAFDAGYDGVIPTLLDPSKSGYINYLNGPLTSVDPFQDAFAALWDSVQGRPETILMHGRDRLTLSNLLTSQSSASYRITIANSETEGSNGVVGAMATAVQNGVTGDLVELSVHPYIPRGICPILSWTLPLPDSNVDTAWAVYNVQDYIGLSYPVIQQTYDFGVYWQGTFVATAPAWSGIVAGITA